MHLLGETSVFSFRRRDFLLQSFRLNQFPVELRRFWAENYQPYRASVFVAGRHLAGARGERKEFELVVPGTYRWLPYPDPRAVEIDGRRVGAGQVLALTPGAYTAHFVDDVPAGMLVLAMEELPQGGNAPFYGSP